VNVPPPPAVVYAPPPPPVVLYPSGIWVQRRGSWARVPDHRFHKRVKHHGKHHHQHDG